MHIGSLTVRPRGNAAPATRVDGALRLQAESAWVVAGPALEVDAVAVALPDRVCERLAGDVLELSFGNAIGRFSGGPLGPIHVFSGKWGEADYEQLLERISAAAAALPFSAGAPSALPFERAVLDSKDVLYHTFIYLRHVLTASPASAWSLRPALENILADPHRKTRRAARVVAIDVARRVDASALIDVVAGRWPMTRSNRRSSDFASLLRGWTPTHIEESVTEDTLDTPENRLVKAFLDLCAFVIERMRDRVARATTSSMQRRVLEDCDALERVLRPIRRHALWQSVGPLVHVAAASMVLQRRRAYRAVFDCHTRMRLGSRVPMGARSAQALLEVKDIAALYEMWSCFAVIAAVSETLGTPALVDAWRRDDFGLDVPWQYRARWGDGTALSYNETFASDHPPERRAYSVRLRPDLTLRVPDGRPNSGLHLLDAKFKVDWLGGPGPSSAPSSTGSCDDVEEDERVGRFQNADIYKMHTYRDALPGARTAWVLYPGTSFRFFSAAGGAHPTPVSLPPGASGVGAVPLGADGPGAELVAVCRALVGVG